MKFIVDAQLPKSLSDVLNSKGFNSIHTLELPDKNKTRDHNITKLSIDEGRIIITKDTDFLHTHLIKDEPKKLILIKTGNIKNSALLDIVITNLDFIISSISSNNLVEINVNEIIVHS